MSDEVLTVAQRNLRGTDTNSLLRLYDLVLDIFNKSKLLQERAKAEKVSQRIAKELQRRKVFL